MNSVYIPFLKEKDQKNIDTSIHGIVGKKYNKRILIYLGSDIED